MDVAEKRYMDESNIKSHDRKELYEMIRQEVRNLAFETLRDTKRRKKDKNKNL